MQVTRLQLSAHKHMCNSVYMANKKQDNHNKGTESHIVVQICVKRLYMDLGMGLTLKCDPCDNSWQAMPTCFNKTS